MSTKVHNAAVVGFGEGTNDVYDRVRPSYPAKALQTIHSALPPPKSPAGLSILEPGAGTGIFSRTLLSPPTPEHPTFKLKSLIAVEPSSGMRTAWEKGMRKISNNKKDTDAVELKIVQGSFNDFSQTGIQIGSVDGIIIAQAWHWCTDFDNALREIAKYLQPNGVLILIWNLEYDGEGWYRDLRRAYEARNKKLDTPQYYRGLWKVMYQTQAYKELFKEPEESSSIWELPISEDLLVDRIFSKSYLTEAHLSGQPRKDLENELRSIIRGGDKEWVDKENGIFQYKYYTDVIIIKRKED